MKNQMTSKGIEEQFPQIIPAVLSNDLYEFYYLVKIASSFANRIQIDFMDKVFVETKSVPVEAVSGLPQVESKLEAHLMVKEPEKYIEVLSKSGFEMMIFHIESRATEQPLEVIEKARKSNMGVGIAVNPETDLKQIETLIRYVDEVLFMSVEPGAYGSPIVWEAIEKAKLFKARNPGTIIGIDGGVKLENMAKIFDSGAERIYVGSAIFLAENPCKEYLAFQKLADEERLKRAKK